MSPARGHPTRGCAHRSAALGARRAALAAALLVAALLACADVSDSARDDATAATGRAPAVVLISMDGTRAEEARDLPAFRRIAERGIAPTPLRPVFPTNTFPNHVSLVTGVRPARHGIVNNSFRDPERGSFRYDNDPTWIEVPPLWSLLAGAGLRSVSFHWVGSQGPWRDGTGPAEWRVFDASVPERDKVAQIIAWLDAPPAERHALITAWFRGADGAGHRSGPDSDATRRALRTQNVALETLLDHLDAGGGWATTTLLVVSDHGMAAVERRVDLAAALDASGVRATLRGGGGFGTVTLHRGDRRPRAERVETVLRVARELGLEAWPRGAPPRGLDDAHPRFGDVLVMAPLGTGFSRAGGVGGRLASAATLRGSHGYAPELPAMQAMFAAAGRGVGAGRRLETPHCLDVAPTVLALLGVPVPAALERRALRLGPALD